MTVQVSPCTRPPTTAQLLESPDHHFHRVSNVMNTTKTKSNSKKSLLDPPSTSTSSPQPPTKRNSSASTSKTTKEGSTSNRSNTGRSRTSSKQESPRGVSSSHDEHPSHLTTELRKGRKTKQNTSHKSDKTQKTDNKRDKKDSARAILQEVREAQARLRAKEQELQELEALLEKKRSKDRNKPPPRSASASSSSKPRIRSKSLGAQVRSRRKETDDVASAASGDKGSKSSRKKTKKPTVAVAIPTVPKSENPKKKSSKVKMTSSPSQLIPDDVVLLVDPPPTLEQNAVPAAPVRDGASPGKRPSLSSPHSQRFTSKVLQSTVVSVESLPTLRTRTSTTPTNDRKNDRKNDAEGPKSTRSSSTGLTTTGAEISPTSRNPSGLPPTTTTTPTGGRSSTRRIGSISTSTAALSSTTTRSPGPSPALANKIKIFGDNSRSSITAAPMPGPGLGILGIRTNPNRTSGSSTTSGIRSGTTPPTKYSTTSEGDTFTTPEAQQQRATIDYGLASLSLPFVDMNDPSLMPFGTRRQSRPQKQLSQFASSRNALIEALTTPVRKQKETMASIDKTPRTLKRGYVELNLKKTSPTVVTGAPGQRCMDSSHHGRDKAKTFIDYALERLPAKSRQQQLVKKLVKKIERLGGFPKTRRLSLRDNEMVGQMIKAVRYDPTIVDIKVDPVMFGTISSTLLSQCIDSLRLNLHVRSLSFQGVELGNDFLYQLAASMEYNFSIQEIDLSSNCFTNEGISTFCQALANSNETVTKLNLKNQTTPISDASQADVMEAFEQNKTLTHIELDFISEDGPEKLKKILKRNRKLAPTLSPKIDKKLISVLSDEVDRAQELWEQQQDELKLWEEEEVDWDYAMELAELFDRCKLKQEVEDNVKTFAEPVKRRTNADDLSGTEKSKFLFGDFMKNMEDSVMAFKEDGSFLTPDFIAKYFQERPEDNTITFDFHGQWKLFKRFPVHDPARQLIVDRFVEAIARHPRADQITGINMANTAAGDDFLIALSKLCLENPSLLPKLHTINFETNYINEPGVVALSKLVASKTACRYMQVIRLENQKGLLKSRAEFALAKAMRTNRSIVVLSLTIRNLLERERIGKYILRNVDFIRQARQQRRLVSGKQRQRNPVEQVFDRVRMNDENLDKVDMVGNERFLTLTEDEKIKAAQAFAENSYVKELILNGCGIDDAFARALADCFVSNKTLEKVHLDFNDISGEGIKALFAGLGKNTSIKELRLHKQSRFISTADEEKLADQLGNNTTLTTLGLSFRSKMASVTLDRITKHNKNLELKAKATAKGEEDSP